MVKSTIVVLRDGKQQLLPIEEVVIGDLLLLSSGDMIPADLQLLGSKDLFVGQSSLTGESEPVAK